MHLSTFLECGIGGCMKMEGCMHEGGKGINELTGLSLSSVLCFPEGQLEAREGCNNTLSEERVCPILPFQVTVYH